ncbi:hypothetical protein GCM10023078_10520 [Gibbsiella greigii]
MIRIMIAGALLVAHLATAGTLVTKKDQIKNTEVKTASIYFSGEVNNESEINIIAAVTEIADTYPHTEKVVLYINSSGGDMDAGYAIYTALKHSPVKLETVNVAMTGSAATLIYCATDARYATPLSHFLLHPSATSNIGKDFVKPDEARLMAEENDIYNQLFFDIYRSCTRLPAPQIKNILSAENNRLMPDVVKATEYGLVTKGIKEKERYDVSYFINDKGN